MLVLVFYSLVDWLVAESSREDTLDAACQLVAVSSLSADS